MKWIPKALDIFQLSVGTVNSIHNSPEHPFLGAGIFTAELLQKLFCIFPLGMSVRRTGAFADGKLVFMLKSDDIRFVHVHQRPDYSQIHTVQISDRGKGMKTSLEDQGKQHGFHHIILMVGIGHLIAAGFLDCLIKRALSHFCAESTGAAFFSDMKYNLINICFYDCIVNIQLSAESLNLA